MLHTYVDVNMHTVRKYSHSATTLQAMYCSSPLASVAHVCTSPELSVFTYQQLHVRKYSIDTIESLNQDMHTR